MTKVQLILGLAIGAVTASLQARPRDPYAYAFVLTPEEAKADPAISRRYTRPFDACQKGAVTTAQNAGCLEAEFVRQDAMLNGAWKAALGRVGSSMRGRLIAAERDWAAKRDPFCRKAADAFAGGTIMPIIYSGCRVEQTIRRTIWLERLR